LNQSDEAEKYQQIPIMHLIFAHARRVIVYLGSSSPDGDVAMHFIRDLHAAVEKGKEHDVPDSVALNNWPLSLLPTGPVSRDDISSLSALYMLLMRPWWYRAWIVQEISFAQEIIVQCCEDSVSYSQLQVALHIMRKIHLAFVAYTDVVKSIVKENPGFESDWPAQAINNALNLLWPQSGP